MPPTPIAIFGEVLFDCFPDGGRRLGGAPFNVAWHLSAFGAAPRLISAVGDDPDGAAVHRAMQDWGMDTSGLRVDPDHPTGQVQVQLVDGEPTYEIVPDCAFDYITARGLATDGILYHGTLATRGTVSAATLTGLKARGRQLRFVDVNLRAPWWSRPVALSLVAEADWVKLSEEELAQLAEPSNAALADRANDFRRRHALAGLIVTLGAEGALAVTADAAPARIAPAPAPVVADTVGAGDAFASVLILGLVEGWPLATTIERAQAFASRIVAQPGAIAQDRALYRPFIDAWGLRTPRP